MERVTDGTHGYAVRPVGTAAAGPFLLNHDYRQLSSPSMFTIKVTYGGQTRKATFSDSVTFPSFADICSQVCSYRRCSVMSW